MDPDTESLLVSTCLAIGGFEDISPDMEDDRQVYIMGDECLECLKDIKKFIKYFDQPGDNVALNFLGKLNVLEKDLIPIMLLNSPSNGNPVKERLILACIEIIVPMTWIIDYKELQTIASREEDNSLVGNLHQRLEILRGYKKAFLQPGVLQTIISVLLRPLEVEARMRTTRDQAIIRLGLSLFRNLVAIPDTDSSISGTMDQFISSILQEELLVRFDKEGVMALLIALGTMASEEKYRDFNAMTMEILYYIYAGVDAADLVPTATGRVKNSQLQDLLNKEEKAKKLQSSAGMKRHDRFGTTGEARLQDGTRMIMHQKGALFASFERQLDTVKKPKARTKRHKDADDYKKTVTKAGLSGLRALALTLLEDCFNPLFNSLRKDIELGREKIKSHHRGQYHYLMAFMLNFQRLYLDMLEREYEEQKKTARPHQLDGLQKAHLEQVDSCDYDLLFSAIEVANVFQVIHYLRTLMDKGPKEREWEEIQKTMNCLQELLATLYAMAKSPKEEYREASDIVQNNLYYEEGTLDLFLDLAKDYRSQSTRFLHTLVRMIHTLLKTLENYSHSKSYVTIVKRRAIRKHKDAEKKAVGATNKDAEQQEQLQDGASENAIQDAVQVMEDVQQENADGEQDEEDEEQDDLPTHTTTEHRFIFKEFERKFACESVVRTYCAFLENFIELDETQLHWAASMFHRIAVNTKNMAVFYKASTLQQFHEILQNGVNDTKRDLVPFISYVFHQFFKRLQEYPLLIVEVFFPRTNKSCLDINFGRDEAEKEQHVLSQKTEKRLLATELQVDPTRPEPEQIKIAVMALIDEDEIELVEWVVEVLKDAVTNRHLMTFRTESELEENPDLMYSVENVEDIPIVATTPARQQAMRLKPRFRLLLKLLHFVKDESNGILLYKIPKDIPTDTLADYRDMIEAILQEDPAGYAHYDYAELIQNINKSSKKSSAKSRSSGEGGRTRQPKEAEVYRSTEYVIDSENEDDAYFDTEQRLRERVAKQFKQAEERQRQIDVENARNKNKKNKKTGKDNETAAAATVSLTDDEDENQDEDEDEDDRPLFPQRLSDVDSDSEEEIKRPQPKSTSDVESDAESDDGERGYKMSRILPNQTYGSQRKSALSDNSDDDSDGQSDDEDGDQALQPLSLTQRLAAQAGGNKRRIVLDDSDEDEDAADGGDLEPGQGSSSQEMEDRPAKKRLAFEE